MYDVIFNTHDVVLLMTAYQCILFALLLLTIKRDKYIRNVFLAFFLLQQAAIPLDILISFGAEFRHIAIKWSPDLFYVFGFGYWLEGPLLLWYTRSLIYKDYRLRLKDIIYLLPFIAYAGYQLIFYYSLDVTDKVSIQEEYDLSVAPQIMNYVTLFRELFRVALGIICLIEIKRYTQHIRTNFSDIDKIDLTWLKILVIGFLAIRFWAVLVAAMIILAISFGISTNFEIMGLIGNYTTFFMVSVLIFFGLGHSSVFEGLEQRQTPNEEPAKDEPEQAKEKITPELIAQITQYMETEKPYLTPALTLEKLAIQMRIPARLLSNIINRHFNCHFFEFINSYRIDEAKHMLSNQNQSDKTVLDIMLDVGFNSKATFNTLFKKKVGMTPSEYRKSVNTL
ncbi:helix-turn-helix domain-containing protein [Cellvibrio fibrivorans]|uniref:AraC-like DNA-binding protein n=1 Tax=Cellvibrio fibrivorans TaxID=126350 RepID=A0ABU1V197_9GAMM|nr:AraC family transcriptional regulator [Cellvibrio fibrivorans]MDR7091229.1 AraC-like DNA-binding protein [Cellvibrio fibrivorans]